MSNVDFADTDINELININDDTLDKNNEIIRKTM